MLKVNMSDLKDKRFIYLKGILFLFILLIASILIIIETKSWLIAILLAVVIWSSARLYYFMFYVIEKYVDSEYKFSSIYSFLKYVLGKNKGK